MNTTLIDVLLASAQAHPQAVALDLPHGTLTYTGLVEEVDETAAMLRDLGVGAGDRVGIDLPSATRELYVAILATMAAGAAYVPVDADDTSERKALVFTEAAVCGVLRSDPSALPTTATSAGEREVAHTLVWHPTGHEPSRMTRSLEADDDAWVIFTSGTTGKPKGVAVTHRSAVAFLDAERGLFCPEDPLGPQDRVFAGLSVAFDASIEEMWLAWANAACLVPAPRALVKSGGELGAWLRDATVTVVSTVPSLLSLWNPADLTSVRLLIVGGEACPAELVDTWAPGRAMWNTYGPTEATVVTTAQRLLPGEPVLIGTALAGWRTAVLDADGQPVAPGSPGELAIAGIGLGRYLDPVKDAQKFRAVPALDWSRAYFTGDVVIETPEGLAYRGRSDDQVKINGRRIELGEIDAALSSLPGVAGAAAAVQHSRAGTPVLVGYVVPVDQQAFDASRAQSLLRDRLPVGITVVLGVIDEMPLSIAGKADRKRLPWPLADEGASADLTPTEHAVAMLWSDLTGLPVTSMSARTNFFDIGGTSLATARLAAQLRQRWPAAGVTDVYETADLGELAGRLDARAASSLDATPTAPVDTADAVDARGTQVAVVLGLLTVLAVLGGLVLDLTVRVVTDLTRGTLPWGLVSLVVALALPGVRDVVTAGLVRLLTAGITPGRYPRGGQVHLRVRAAQRILAISGLGHIGGTIRAVWFARLLGHRIGTGVVLEPAVPVVPLLDIADGVALNVGVDIAGDEVQGREFVLGRITVGADSVVAERAVLMPGLVLPAGSHVDAGEVADANRVRPNRNHVSRPASISTSRRWEALYLLTPTLGAMVRSIAALPGLVALMAVLDGSVTGWATALLALMSGATGSLALYALLVAAQVRTLSRAIRVGAWARGSRPAWAAWAVMRLTDEARSSLYPLYASMLTPAWFRLLGACVGRDVEISTASGLPSMMDLADGSFLADDVLAASPTWANGQVHVAPVAVGERSFVGNSGIVQGGTRIGADALIGVLSTAPSVVADGEAWMGRPAQLLRRSPDAGDMSRTYAPTRRLKVARAAVETLRLVPFIGSATMGLLVVVVGWWACDRAGLVGAVGASLAAMVAGGVVAGVVTVGAKWALVGRIEPGEHPLWSPFVWRNELADCFLECLAVPWFLAHAHGTPMMNVWHRLNGAHLAPGAWCDTHWLPEHDLVTIGENAVVGRGTVVQTHLFQDRVMRLQRVEIDADASVGSHCAVLPEAVVGAGAHIDAGSLVMRGENIPGHTVWAGNPVRPVLLSAAD